MRNIAGFGGLVKLATLCVSLVFAMAANAQQIGEGESGFTGLPLDLLPPGARSLGLAGAFTAVADDATASLANPAGLTILTATEFSLHVRNSDTTVGFFEPDAYDNGYFPSSDPVNLTKSYDDSSTDLSYASIVKPFDRWVLAGFYSQSLNFSADQNEDANYLSPQSAGILHVNEHSIDAKVHSFGLSAAFRATDRFSIGVSVARAELDMDMVDAWYSDAGQFLVQLFSAENPELAPILKREIVDDYAQSTIIAGGSDNSLTYNVGLMFRPSDSWSLGLVYTKGAEFEIETRGIGEYRAGCTGATALNQLCQDLGIPNIEGPSIRRTFDTEIHLPDLLTFGVAWRPTDTWLISFDAKRIGYGSGPQIRDITQGYGTDVNDVDLRQAQFQNPAVANLPGAITEEIDDATTFHLGVEKVFVRKNNNTFTVRAGGFTIEDVDGTPLIDSDDTAFTVGIGATFGEMGQFQLDLGASFADATDNIILSGIYRF